MPHKTWIKIILFYCTEIYILNPKEEEAEAKLSQTQVLKSY